MAEEEEFEALRARMMRSLKQVWWFATITLVICFGFMIAWGEWRAVSSLFVALGSLGISRWVIYLREHGMIGSD